MCAASSTAASTGSAICDVHRHGFAPFAVTGSGATRRGSVGEGQLRSGGSFFVRLQGTRGMRQSRSNGASRAVVQVCLLFRPRSAEPQRATGRSCGVEAPTPRDDRHLVVTFRVNALEFEHDRPRRSTNAVPCRMIPPAGFVNVRNILKGSGPVQPQQRLIGVAAWRKLHGFSSCSKGTARRHRRRRAHDRRLVRPGVRVHALLALARPAGRELGRPASVLGLSSLGLSPLGLASLGLASLLAPLGSPMATLLVDLARPHLPLVLTRSSAAPTANWRRHASPAASPSSRLKSRSWR